MATYVVDADRVPWRRGETAGLTFHAQVLLSGHDGGPEALRFRFDPTPSVYAHMHLAAQFQLVLGGKMHMPRGRLDLGPLDVHYTDHNVPYGPFSVADGHDMLVLHTRAGGLMPMSHVDFRRSINLGGRLITGSAEAMEWLDSSVPGVRYKELVPARFGPEVVLVECPPGAALALPAPAYGRYEVVVAGTMLVDGDELGLASFRFVGAATAPADAPGAAVTEPISPLVAGPAGMRVMLLTFDADALEGGLTGDALAELAADELARAI